jgi:hypothetical protein
MVSHIGSLKIIKMPIGVYPLAVVMVGFIGGLGYAIGHVFTKVSTSITLTYNSQLMSLSRGRMARINMYGEKWNLERTGK